MIDRLRPGMLLRLPSGREVLLVRRNGVEWVCQYAERVRGEVEFSGAWLRRYATLANSTARLQSAKV